MNEFTSKAALYLTKMPGAAMTAGRAIVPGLPINSQDRPWKVGAARQPQCFGGSNY